MVAHRYIFYGDRSFPILQNAIKTHRSSRGVGCDSHVLKRLVAHSHSIDMLFDESFSGQTSALSHCIGESNVDIVSAQQKHLESGSTIDRSIILTDHIGVGRCRHLHLPDIVRGHVFEINQQQRNGTLVAILIYRPFYGFSSHVGHAHTVGSTDGDVT